MSNEYHFMLVPTQAFWAAVPHLMPKAFHSKKGTTVTTVTIIPLNYDDFVKIK